MTTKIHAKIQGGLIALIILMPFHAFLTLWLGHLFGHQAIFQAWKEVLVILMLIATIYLYVKQGPPSLPSPVNLAAISYIFIALLISLMVGNFTQVPFWFGVKTDLIFVILFLIAQAVNSKILPSTLTKILLISSTVVAALALIQAWILPANFLTHFGYSSSNIRPVQLVDPAIKSIRAFSTLGGPNQLGAFLILPICITIYSIMRHFHGLQIPLLAILTLALAETFSRSAWLGALAGLAVTAIIALGKKGLVAAGSILLIGLLGLIVILPKLSHTGNLQYYLLHSQAGTTSQKTSNPLHIEASVSGLLAIKSHPLGQGLGSAGPASFRGQFGFIPENYYLQVAVESGLLGLLAFLIFELLVAIRLYRLRSTDTLAVPLLGTLAGVSLVNLLLHGWADSTLAYIFWILAGLTVSQNLNPKIHIPNKSRVPNSKLKLEPK